MMPREGSVIADRYRLQRKVGGGRVSATWRVQDEVTDATCAVKLLHRSMHKNPEALTRFSLEERLARELAGAYFPERIGSGSWNSLRYIAWRWYEGESLRALFERNPKQDAPTVYSIVQETCKALNQVHAAGYAHGDIKPENLFFTDAGEGASGRQLKLLGFDVAARITPVGLSFHTRRKAGEIVGTPLYLSPDLVLGRPPKGGQADLWALAVIVYEALTGRAPFLGNDMAEVLQAILERRAPKPSSLTDSLPGTFDLWWAQALEQDFGSATEFAASLSRALSPALRSSHTQRSALLPGTQLVPVDSVVPVPVSAEPASALGDERLAEPAAAKLVGAAGKLEGAKPLEPAVSALAAPSRGVASSDVPSRGVASSDVASSGVASNGAAKHGNDSASSLVVRVRAIEPERPREAEVKGAAHSGSGTFAPFPSPLRDLRSGMSRKTLVGITPPSSLNAALNQKPAAPNTALVRSASERPGEDSAGVIEGAPCKAIEVSAIRLPNPTPHVPAELMRRPANPTMPFARPRFEGRPRRREPEVTEVEAHAALALEHGLVPDPASPAAWRENTRTLRFVLSSRDHKPQRIAAVLVCAAAALVIFLVYRSPVAGIGTLGETTESLSPAVPPMAPPPVSPSVPSTEPGSAEAAQSAPAPVTEAEAPSPADPAGKQGLPGEELAPGLRVPAGEAPGASRANQATKAAPSRPAAAPRAAPPPSPRRAPPAAAPAAPRPAPPQPKTRAPKANPPAPEPPRRPSGEFDFGI